jgi:hypothetical protein
MPSLIEQYVKAVISEDSVAAEAGVSGYTAGGGMGYGVQRLGGPSVAQIFLKPFANAFKVAASEGGQTISRVMSLIKAQVATVISKDLALEYTKIWKDHATAVQQFKQKYAEAYKDIDRVTTGNEDFLFVAFMLEPGAMLASYILPKSPKVGVSIANWLSGGSLGKQWEREKRNVQQDIGHASYRSRSEELSFYDWLRKRMTRVSDVLDDSQVGSEMAHDAQRIIKEQARRIREMVVSVAVAQTPQDIVRALHSSRQIDMREIIKTLSGKMNQQQIDAQMLHAMKESVKTYVLTQINTHIKSVRASGMSADSLYVKSYTKLYHEIEQVKI